MEIYKRIVWKQEGIRKSPRWTRNYAPLKPVGEAAQEPGFHERMEAVMAELKAGRRGVMSPVATPAKIGLVLKWIGGRDKGAILPADHRIVKALHKHGLIAARNPAGRGSYYERERRYDEYRIAPVPGFGAHTLLFIEKALRPVGRNPPAPRRRGA